MQNQMLSLKRHILIALCLAFLAGMLYSYHFLITQNIYHDNLHLYSFYFDHLNSLARFGEPAYWFPHVQNGHPGYLFSLIGNINCSSPPYALLSIFYWVFGTFGLELFPIYTSYIFYFGFLIPFLFVFSLLLLSRTIFNNNAPIIFTMILGAFSPGVVANQMDIGFLEPTTYCIFFLVGFINFLRHPAPKNFWLFLLSLLILIRTIGFPVLFSPLLIFPALFIFLLFWKENLILVRNAFSTPTLFHWGFSIIAICICAFPNLMVYHQLLESEIIRSRIKDSLFDTTFILNKGNPIEFLFSSVPFSGFDWLGTNWAPQNIYSSVWYLGLLSQPLMWTGLIFGNKKIAASLLFLLIIYSCIIALNSHSPIFFPFLSLIDSLRTNHFADIAFRASGFLIIIYGSALGLDALSGGERKRYLTFTIFLIISSFLGWKFHAHWAPQSYLYHFSNTYIVIATFIFTVLIFWLSATGIKNTDTKKQQMLLFYLFVVVDLSIAGFLYFRPMMSYKPPYNLESLSSNFIGLKTQEANHHAQTLLSHRGKLRALRSGFPMNSIEEYSIHFKAHLINEANEVDYVAALQPLGSPIRSVAINKDQLTPEQLRRLQPQIEELTPFRGDRYSADINIQVESKTYNKVFLTVKSPLTGLFLIRNVYSPYWSAKVNGENTHVYQTLDIFKSVRVPQGTSKVELTFFPKFIIGPYLVSYLIVFLVLLMAYWKELIYKFNLLRVEY